MLLVFFVGLGCFFYVECVCVGGGVGGWLCVGVCVRVCVCVGVCVCVCVRVRVCVCGCVGMCGCVWVWWLSNTNEKGCQCREIYVKRCA